MNKKRDIMLSIIILLIGLMIAGGTYAFFVVEANITNANYVGMTTCFEVDYNIDNGDGTQDITGILFPSLDPSNGLSGRVGLKVNDSCSTTGIGTLKLHVNSETDSHLTEIASSHCEDKKTGDILTEYITEESCSSANGKWKSYPTSYCEDNSTLQVLKNYTTSASCTSNNGTWITNGSPLKYAVYSTNDTSSTPISVGHITDSDIGNDITIHDNTIINDSEKYFYVYIWLDGYLTDNTYANLPFGGYISANATQFDWIYPSTYQQVGYLKSTGTQHINTEYIPKVSTKMELSLSFDGSFKSKNTYGGTGALFRTENYIYQINFGEAQNQPYTLFIWITPNVTTSNPETITINENILRNRNTLVLESDSITYGNVSRTLTPKTNNSTNQMSLFGSLSTPFNSYNMLVYSLKFYENNKIVKYYIPSYRKNDGVRGLYEVINGTFYTNIGSGTFEIGPEI